MLKQCIFFEGELYENIKPLSHVYSMEKPSLADRFRYRQTRFFYKQRKSPFSQEECVTEQCKKMEDDRKYSSIDCFELVIIFLCQLFSPLNRTADGGRP
jgi:hypothetical protein